MEKGSLKLPPKTVHIAGHMELRSMQPAEVLAGRLGRAVSLPNGETQQSIVRKCVVRKCLL